MSTGALFSGKTVEDAIAEGLRAMGVTEADVEIEIVSRGSRGLFGIGSEPAQVRLKRRAVAPAEQVPPVVAPVAPEPAARGSRSQPLQRCRKQQARL